MEPVHRPPEPGSRIRYHGNFSTMKCTWVDCKEEAAYPQKDNDGQVWSNLCPKHESEINESIKQFNALLILRNWIRAQGGAKIAASRMI